MSYTDIVQQTIVDSNKILKVLVEVENRLIKAQEIEGVLEKQQSYSSKTLERNITNIGYLFAHHLQMTIAPGINNNDIDYRLSPAEMEKQVRGFIDTKKQESFNEIVKSARKLVGKDPAHTGDKLIFQLTDNHYLPDMVNEINLLGRFLNIVLNRINPTIAHDELLSYIYKEKELNYEEELPTIKDIFKIKYYKNKKIKIYFYNYIKLEHIGKLIREELTGQDWKLADGTVLICP